MGERYGYHQGGTPSREGGVQKKVLQKISAKPGYAREPITRKGMLQPSIAMPKIQLVTVPRCKKITPNPISIVENCPQRNWLSFKVFRARIHTSQILLNTAPPQLLNSSQYWITVVRDPWNICTRHPIRSIDARE